MPGDAKNRPRNSGGKLRQQKTEEHRGSSVFCCRRKYSFTSSQDRVSRAHYALQAQKVECWKGLVAASATTTAAALARLVAVSAIHRTIATGFKGHSS